MASNFATLRKRGYGTIYAVTVEGIPYVFTEGPIPLRVDAESEPGVPTNYTSAVSALAVINETQVDQELDREAAVARAKSLPLLLTWGALEDASVLPLLFRRPEYFTTLSADVEATDTTINVAKATSFPSSGEINIGRERIKYTGTTSTSFTGCTRGMLGYAYKFRKDDPGSHGIVTPTPYSWRGRFVTVYEHLLSPEGRILDSTWTEGTYKREIFKGYIAEPPVPDKLGMKVQVTNLVRLAAQELGSSLRGETVGYRRPDDVLALPVYVDEGSVINFLFDMSNGAQVLRSAPVIEQGKTAGDWPEIPPGAMSLGEYMRAVADSLMDYFDSVGSYDALRSVTAGAAAPLAENGPSRVSLSFNVDPDEGGNYPNSVEVVVSNACYWLQTWPLPYGDQELYNNALGLPEVKHLYLPLRGDTAKWLPIKDLEGDNALDFTVPSSGLGVVDAGDNSEVVRWSSKVSVDNLGASMAPYALLYIEERMVGAQFASVGQLPADLNEDGSLEVVAGKIGTLDDVAETLIVSSGTGLRGSKDTLALGFGMGIPEEWVDIDATGSAPITTEVLPLITLGRSSFADIFGGWFQLAGQCLALRRDSTGVLQFQRVDVVPAQVIQTGGPGFLGQALAKGDIVVGGTSVPRLVIAPNQVVIDTTAGPYDSAQYTFNAVGRIQSEGSYSTSLAVPGGRASVISAAVLSIMARGDGQSIIKFAVAPWIDIQVGDPVSVTVGHPLTYDWSDGTRQPGNIPGRAVGHSYNLKTGEQSLTILLDGILQSAYWLCPTTTVSNVSGSDVTVGDGSWFQSGETVRFYNRGTEATESGDLLVDTVSGNVLTLDAAPPAWLTSANATRATHPLYTAGSTDQQNPFIYARADRTWQ